ncbi:MAG: nodulation protein NfeD [Methanothrix sp.]|jgi:membrane-bound serine protease (ClpP class)|uniref:Nodulation efficiency protein NfeD n=1 Tax=Methanothrix harundinacea TaxID=301375 RepID=A0A124G315_9EURY|nr:MAG: nodulation protein NfeD [Methanosaeta sp. SDB]KUK43767.1 MAG: Nodulation efficiency protein NfeD [Methanothrix harundinacea]MDD2638285.1 nodulation protein NfeD [Methanothrix sp.]MDI9398896.1 nodulation protein NfeD [Euryarchaeota archaeon]KUK95500.1 MAG: Nodulation efficiency protein NfeD [Methanothrix harundinacea]
MRRQAPKDSALFGLAPSFILLATIATLCLAGSALGEASVVVVALEGDITPASDDIIAEAILQAELVGSEAIVITLDTPGGGLAETKEIAGLMERTSLPVIGYVYPSGATAWSAGTIILLSSDIAAMVPGTIIGSAQPVSIGPTGTEPVNDTKVINAVVALAEEKARTNNRNTTAAREFVLSNLNLNAEEALKFGVIEIVSPSLESLMDDLDGMEAKNKTLATSGAEIVRFEPSFRLRVLAVLSDPLLAGLLLIVGLYALIFGLSNPGLGAELVGVITLALGLIGLGFSVNLGALFLIILGLVLLLVELNSPGFGLLGAAGLACMVIGSILLVPIGSTDWYTPAEYKMDAFVALIVPSLVIGGFFVFALYKVAEARRRPTYSEVMNREVAEALDRIDPKGHVIYNGEYWAAVSEEPIEPGEIVEVVGKERMVLKVRRR